MKEPYYTKSPVLFLIFNRPDVTRLVFEEIRIAKPQILYLAADGPRKERETEINTCKQTREIINLIDWPCEVKTLFREENLGCKYAVSSSIDWFFQNEEEGIILEDDCLPNNDFFFFCDIMLERYRHDTRIRHITGCNLQHGKKWGSDTYYFSRNIHVWGWASWKRVWQDYDVELSRYNIGEVEAQFFKIFDEPLLVKSWKEIFINLKAGVIDTWDYQLGISNYFNNGVCIIPNYNLISNLGFGKEGTHTLNADDPHANIPLENLPCVINNPKYFLPIKEADNFILFRDFNVLKRKSKLKYKIKKILRLKL